MNSIYKIEDNALMLSRIDKLTSDSQPIWGKMNAAQMCEHCDRAIQVAFGKQDLKINFLMRLLGKMLKKKVFYGDQMKKNSPTAQEFIVTGDYDFETAKEKLKNSFSQFASEGTNSIKTLNHPFWGKLTYEEWDLLMWKHLDHHLTQFGV